MSRVAASWCLMYDDGRKIGPSFNGQLDGALMGRVVGCVSFCRSPVTREVPTSLLEHLRFAIVRLISGKEKRWQLMPDSGALRFALYLCFSFILISWCLVFRFTYIYNLESIPYSLNHSIFFFFSSKEIWRIKVLHSLEWVAVFPSLRLMGCLKFIGVTQVKMDMQGLFSWSEFDAISASNLRKHYLGGVWRGWEISSSPSCLSLTHRITIKMMSVLPFGIVEGSLPFSSFGSPLTMTPDR